ncbi:alphaN-acetylglucosamine transferase [Aspergillus ellipticus CBS 707.79]|uniref:AlphaN-acetylglucosamine transferase n=1 Tax=Aspergillus ellipticus CBS 707.79 TaxID=1448320 RepID=A0A319DUA6_9EURO|nr:alphaN-acetylglucosamine transferase [Aspergillus ellipticus CBS 707.79]
MGARKAPVLPYRRGSDASEADFFDIPDEPCWAIVKRQLRYLKQPRTWLVFFMLVILTLFLRREKPPPPPLPHIDFDRVDWSRYAYSQYATSSPYLCNALIVFDTLQRLGSRAQRVLFYPENWDVLVEDTRDRDSQLLAMAQEKYNALLVPIDVQMVKAGSGPNESWDKSISKLLAFGETEFERIIHIDSDVSVLQNLDELFFLPSAQVAMPRAYWELPYTKQLSSLLIVLEPAFKEWYALMDAANAISYGQVDTNITARYKYDMELMNERYGDSAMVLPHRQYGLVTGEFRVDDHRAFLGNEHEEWDPEKVLAEAKLVHFSDWPLPKPWVMWPQELLADILPKCKVKPGTMHESGCKDREIWRKLYDDFRRRRRDVCKLLSYPAPNWPPREKTPGLADPPAGAPEAPVETPAVN